MKKMVHPVQPLYLDDHEVVRFKPNAIIRYLFDTGKLNLNDIAVMKFSDEDREQVAQLLGYSLAGFSDLSYVREETLRRAERQTISRSK